MLQRSPTYVASLPNEDPLAAFLSRFLPGAWVYRITRWMRVLFQINVYAVSRRWPRLMKKVILDRARKALGDPKFQELLTQSGFEPVLDSSPQKAQAFLEEERRRLLPVIESIDLAKK